MLVTLLPHSDALVHFARYLDKTNTQNGKRYTFVSERNQKVISTEVLFG